MPLAHGPGSSVPLAHGLGGIMRTDAATSPCLGSTDVAASGHWSTDEGSKHLAHGLNDMSPIGGFMVLFLHLM